jgi:hypothetical protein
LLHTQSTEVKQKVGDLNDIGKRPDLRCIAGVIETGESLIAGDNNAGELKY